MKQLLQIVANTQKRLLLNIMYALGIGIPAIIAKLLGKQFLNLYPQNTTWSKHKPSCSDDAMY